MDLDAGEYLIPMLIEEGVSLVNWYSFMTDQDAPGLDAFGAWNDMDQTLTLPVALPYLDEGAPKAAVVCLGPPLLGDCPLASATLRPAPGNLDAYRATPPRLGGLFQASVDVASSGHTAAFVVASARQISLPLPSNQWLLTALHDPQFLALRNGPTATWELRVPNDPTLAGLRLATQAFLVGGNPRVDLSHGIDLEFGR